MLGLASLVLQIINTLKWNLFWPFFLSIFIHLIAGMLQFTRMVLLLPEKE